MRKQSVESDLRNQRYGRGAHAFCPRDARTDTEEIFFSLSCRLVNDVRKNAEEYRDRARVSHMSQQAFAYEVAVKEYLRKVRKLLPDWVRRMQTNDENRQQVVQVWPSWG